MGKQIEKYAVDVFTVKELHYQLRISRFICEMVRAQQSVC